MRRTIMVALLGMLGLLVAPTAAVAQDDEVPVERLPGMLRDDTWLLRDSTSSGPATTTLQFGGFGIPLMGDWNDDGAATPGRFLAGRWSLRTENTSGGPDLTWDLGRPGDRPVAGDWIGDVATFGSQPGVVRSVDDRLRWYLETDRDGSRPTTDGRADITFAYGRAGDLPIVGRWVRPDCFECNPVHQPGVVRVVNDRLLWLLKTDDPYRGGRADVALWFGRAGDLPVVGDWNGDHVDDIGVVRGSKRWLLETRTELHPDGIRTDSDGRHDIAFDYGNRAAGDVPVVWWDINR